VPFALGVLVAPVGVYIRSQLVETLDSPEHHRRAGTGAIVATVLREHWAGLLLGLALISGSTITQYFLITMTPFAIRTLHLPDSTAMLGTVALGVSGGFGALAGGVLADRFGIRAITIVARVLFMLLLFPVMKFLVAHPSGPTLVVAITALGLLHAASIAVGIMLIPLIFPPAVRSTGMAICYSLGVAIFGGTATYVVTWLVGATGDPLASTYYVMAASLVMLLAVLAIRNVDYDARAWPPPVDSEV
jgi:MFS family permease